jgi:hypothetical protein
MDVVGSDIVVRATEKRRAWCPTARPIEKEDWDAMPIDAAFRRRKRLVRNG